MFGDVVVLGGDGSDAYVSGLNWFVCSDSSGGFYSNDVDEFDY